MRHKPSPNPSQREGNFLPCYAASRRGSFIYAVQSIQFGPTASDMRRGHGCYCGRVLVSKDGLPAGRFDYARQTTGMVTTIEGYVSGDYHPRDFLAWVAMLSTI